MNIKRIMLPSIVGCAILVLASRVFGQTTSHSHMDKRGAFSDIDTYLESQMRQLNIPGMALVIVEGDEIVYFRGFGHARTGGEAPTLQTPFLIGSLTKSITATAVMQLVEGGQVELDAPVQRYLPWFRVADADASAQISVRHLLNHTSGLPQLPGMIALADFTDYPDAIARGVRELATLELARPVGSAFEYSNLNYNILGLIIEAVSGETYANYIQKHIFDPLDMRHSYTSQAVARENGLAIGHRYWFGFPVAEPDLPMPVLALPSGQLIASSEDMGHFMIAHLNGGQYDGVPILSGAGIEALHRPAVEAVEMGIAMGHHAMGWFVEQHGETTILAHPGTVPDFFAYMTLLPEQNRGMVLFVNANHVIMDKLPFTEMGQHVALQLAGETLPPTQFGWVPWMLRGLLSIPVLQAIGVLLTLRRIDRWRQYPSHRPTGMNTWLRHILLPLIPNLALVALPLSLMVTGILGFTRLFIPDFTWLSLVSGGFAFIWMALRTGLVWLRLRQPHGSSPDVEALSHLFPTTRQEVI